MEETKKPRPYFFVDLKWIFGILFAFTFGISMTLANLTAITAEKPATEALTILTASMFSRQGLDDTGDTAEVLRKIKESPEGKFQPIPAFPDIYITEKDVSEKSPRELRLSIFRNIIEPIYKEGPEAMKKKVAVATGQETDQNLGLIEFVTVKNHLFIQKLFLASLVVSLLFLAPFVYFSHRFGKLFAPGLVIFLISFLPASIITFLSLVLKSHPLSAPQGEGIGAQASYTFNDIAPVILPPISRNYLTALGLALILIVSAWIGRIVARRREKASNK